MFSEAVCCSFSIVCLPNLVHHYCTFIFLENFKPPIILPLKTSLME